MASAEDEVVVAPPSSTERMVVTVIVNVEPADDTDGATCDDLPASHSFTFECPATARMSINLQTRKLRKPAEAVSGERTSNKQASAHTERPKIQDPDPDMVHGVSAVESVSSSIDNASTLGSSSSVSNAFHDTPSSCAAPATSPATSPSEPFKVPASRSFLPAAKPSAPQNDVPSHTVNAAKSKCHAGSATVTVAPPVVADECPPVAGISRAKPASVNVQKQSAMQPGLPSRKHDIGSKTPTLRIESPKPAISITIPSKPRSKTSGVSDGKNRKPASSASVLKELPEERVKSSSKCSDNDVARLKEITVPANKSLARPSTSGKSGEKVEESVMVDKSHITSKKPGMPTKSPKVPASVASKTPVMCPDSTQVHSSAKKPKLVEITSLLKKRSTDAGHDSNHNSEKSKGLHSAELFYGVSSAKSTSAETCEFRVSAASSTTSVVEDAAKTRNSRIPASVSGSTKSTRTSKDDKPHPRSILSAAEPFRTKVADDGEAGRQANVSSDPLMQPVVCIKKEILKVSQPLMATGDEIWMHEQADADVPAEDPSENTDSDNTHHPSAVNTSSANGDSSLPSSDLPTISPVKSHSQSHSLKKEKQHSCDICRRNFSTKQALQVHCVSSKIHRDNVRINYESPAENSVSDQSSFEIISENHTKSKTVKPRSCRICNKYFGSRQALRVHRASKVHLDRKRHMNKFGEWTDRRISSSSGKMSADKASRSDTEEKVPSPAKKQKTSEGRSSPHTSGHIKGTDGKSHECGSSMPDKTSDTADGHTPNKSKKSPKKIGNTSDAAAESTVSSKKKTLVMSAHTSHVKKSKSVESIMGSKPAPKVRTSLGLSSSSPSSEDDEFRNLVASSTTEVVEDATKMRNSRICASQQPNRETGSGRACNSEQVPTQKKSDVSSANASLSLKKKTNRAGDTSCSGTTTDTTTPPKNSKETIVKTDRSEPCASENHTPESRSQDDSGNAHSQSHRHMLDLFHDLLDADTPVSRDMREPNPSSSPDGSRSLFDSGTKKTKTKTTASGSPNSSTKNSKIVGEIASPAVTKNYVKREGEAGKNFCGHCKLMFRTPETYSKHLKLHGGDRLYQCDQCNRGYNNKQLLREHYRSHTGEMPFKCKICGRRFQRCVYLRTHMRVHRSGMKHRKPVKCLSRTLDEVANDEKMAGKSENGTQEGSLGAENASSPSASGRGEEKHVAASSRCRICHKRFTSPKSLKCHMSWHERLASRPQQKFDCDLCKTEFRCRQNQERHFGSLKHQQQVLASSLLDDNVPPQSEKDAADSGNQGDAKDAIKSLVVKMNPDESSESSFSFDQNENELPNPDHYMCNTCWCVFPDRWQFNQHCRQTGHGGSQYGCSHCGKSFPSRDCLQRHAESHNMGRPYTCDICGSSFKSKNCAAAHRSRKHRSKD